MNDIREVIKPYLAGKKLNLGCGATKMAGFINADLYGDADILFDCRKPWPVEPKSLDTVYAHHILEHFDADEIFDVFWEIGAALKDGGHLVAHTPHAASSHQFACPQHKTGFTENSLHHYNKRTFAAGGVSAGMGQGIRLHNWTTVQVFLVPNVEYEKADLSSPEFQFAVRHYNNVISEVVFVLRKDGD
jgi:SAM-dependent methyltransferase